jgi:hypothetical protein
MLRENAGSSGCGSEPVCQPCKSDESPAVAGSDGSKVRLEKKVENRPLDWKGLNSASYYSAPSEPVAWEELKATLDA